MAWMLIQKNVLYLLLALWTVFSVIRYLYGSTPRGRIIIIKLLVSMTISVVTVTGVFLVPTLWWLQAVVVFSTLCSSLLTYLVTDQILNDAPPQPMLKHALFPVIVVISIISFLLVFWERNELLAYLDHRLSHLPWEHYAYYLGKDSFEVFLIILIIKVYWKSLRRHYGKLTYFVRRWICIVGFSLSIGYILALDYPLVTMLLFGSSWHVGKQFLRIFEELPFWLLVIGFITPNMVLSAILRPLEFLLAQQRLRKYYLLRYLYAQMLSVAPNVHLPYEPLKDLRILIEISDARQTIWSNTLFTEPLTAEVEAMHLFLFVKKHVVFHETGPYQPPKTLEQDILLHNLAVAKRLMLLRSINQATEKEAVS